MGDRDRKSKLPTVGLGIALVLGVTVCQPRSASSAHDPADPSWGCYDPEPGHPTAAERTAFFQEIAGPSRSAEERYGVPAAGLAAMSMLESGYGFTRTAQFANNLFGWKAPRSDVASYVLTCQPASDPGNHYRRFASRAEAIDQVGSHLGTDATHTEYANATKIYQHELIAGTPVAKAVLHWVQRIQQGGYNPDPRYVGRVITIANNYQSPGDTVSPEFSLYPLSEMAQPANAETAVSRGSPPVSKLDQQTSALQRDIAAKITTKFATGGRYVVGVDTITHPHEYCKAMVPGDPLLKNPLVAPYERLAGSENAKILECTYPFKGPDLRSGWVLVLAESADNIATRIASACAETAPEKSAACAEEMLGPSPMPWGSNNFIFPITGFINEPCGGPLDRLIGFRHGVTVQYGCAP